MIERQDSKSKAKNPRIVEKEADSDDLAKFDSALRPGSFAEYVGQQELKKNLQEEK